MASSPASLDALSVPRSPRHFAGFDGLRAIAAVSVVMLHTAGSAGFSLHSPLGFLTARGDFGVTIFFLISGFLLYRPFVVSHLAGRESPLTLKYLERRFLRIIPAYWAALTILVVIGQVSLGPGWQGIVVHYAFLQIYFPQYIFNGITPSWSLCTEMAFYLFLPLYAAFIVRRRRSPGSQLRRELLGIAGMFVVSFGFRIWEMNLPLYKTVDGHVVAICAPHCFTEPAYASLLGTWLPARIDLFGAGMLLAVLSVWFSEHSSEPRVLSNRWMPATAWVGALGLYVLSGLLISDHSIFYSVSSGSRLLNEALYLLSAFLLLLPAVFGPQDRSIVRRFLRWWPIAATGVISYGIYLWHLNLMQMVHNFLHGHGHRITFVRLFLLTLVASMVVASVSYFVIEKPALRLKGRLPWWTSKSST